MESIVLANGATSVTSPLDTMEHYLKIWQTLILFLAQVGPTSGEFGAGPWFLVINMFHEKSEASTPASWYMQLEHPITLLLLTWTESFK